MREEDEEYERERGEAAETNDELGMEEVRNTRNVRKPTQSKYSHQLIPKRQWTPREREWRLQGRQQHRQERRQQERGPLEQ